MFFFKAAFVLHHHHYFVYTMVLCMCECEYCNYPIKVCLKYLGTSIGLC